MPDAPLFAVAGSAGLPWSAPRGAAAGAVVQRPRTHTTHTHLEATGVRTPGSSRELCARETHEPCDSLANPAALFSLTKNESHLESVRVEHRDQVPTESMESFFSSSASDSLVGPHATLFLFFFSSSSDSLIGPHATPAVRDQLEPLRALEHVMELRRRLPGSSSLAPLVPGSSCHPVAVLLGGVRRLKWSNIQWGGLVSQGRGAGAIYY